MRNTPSAIGLILIRSTRGLHPPVPGTIVKLYGGVVSSKKKRKMINVNQISLGTRLLSFLADSFPILVHNEFAYIGTVITRGMKRDLYVPTRDKKQGYVG